MLMSLASVRASIQQAALGNLTDLEKVLTALVNGDVGSIGRAVAIPAGATTLDPETHGGKQLLLSSASAIAVTLPPATGSGVVYKFMVSVAVLTAGATFTTNGTDIMKGLVFSMDNDLNAVTGYAASAAGDDVFTMNGTTMGGLQGDWVEFTDLAAGVWGVTGAVVVPAGSNPADPFS